MWWSCDWIITSTCVQSIIAIYTVHKNQGGGDLFCSYCLQLSAYWLTLWWTSLQYNKGDATLLALPSSTSPMTPAESQWLTIVLAAAESGTEPVLYIWPNKPLIISTMSRLCKFQYFKEVKQRHWKTTFWIRIRIYCQ